MKYLAILFFSAMVFGQNVFALDACDKYIEGKYANPKCSAMANEAAKRECYMALVEEPIHKCLSSGEAEARNKCIVSQLDSVANSMPKECIAKYKSSIDSRLSSQEKSKYGGKSSLEINSERIKTAKELKEKAAKKEKTVKQVP